MKTTRQRYYEIWATCTWSLSAALSAAFGYWNKVSLFDPHREMPGTPTQLVLTYLMLFGFGFLVWKGYRWAKLLMAVGLIYGTVMSLVDFSKGHLVTGAIPVANSLAQWVLGLATLTFLCLSFLPAKGETRTETGTEMV